MKTLKFILTGIFILSLFTNAFSQREDKVWLFDEAVIKPEQVQNFEKSLKEVIKLFKENSYPYDIQVYRGYLDFKYYFVWELETPSSYEDVTSASRECWSKIDKAVYDNYVQWFESDRQFVVRELGKYSYHPEKPRIAWSEVNYAVWDMHYVKFDKVQEYNELIGKFTELLNKHNFDDPVLMLTGMVGTENPMFMAALVGKDDIDMKQQNRKMWNAFGEEGGELYKKMIPLLRDRDYLEVWFRRDLSYTKD
jgi:hypothetical protein